MPGTTFDVSSRGLSKHITMPQTGLASKLSAANVDTGDNIRVLFLESSLPFVTLLFATIAIWFITPQIYCNREFYRRCFKPVCWYGWWRRWIFDLVWYFVNIFGIAAVIHYLHTRANPIGDMDINLYVAVYSLTIIFLFVFRWFWINSFWNYHNAKNLKTANGGLEFDPEAAIAIAFALFFAVMMVINALALEIVFAINGNWIAFGLFIPVTIWTIVLLIWTGMVYACICRPACVDVVAMNPCATTVYSNNGNAQYVYSAKK